MGPMKTKKAEELNTVDSQSAQQAESSLQFLPSTNTERAKMTRHVTLRAFESGTEGVAVMSKSTWMTSAQRGGYSFQMQSICTWET
jgi:hypothetical protein